MLVDVLSSDAITDWNVFTERRGDTKTGAEDREDRGDGSFPGRFDRRSIETSWRKICQFLVIDNSTIEA